MRKLYTVGEALIDFIPKQREVALKEVQEFERRVGGAPLNVACVAGKLGAEVNMVTQVGRDAFGDLIIDTLKENNVDVSHVQTTEQANTALAFVSLKNDGERDFSFYRKPSADMLYKIENTENVKTSKEDILYFGSVSLNTDDMRKAHDTLIEKHQQTGGIIFFDPNVRLPLWEDEAECSAVINTYIPHADIIKISDEELEFITGIKDETEAVQSLFKGNIKVVVYTKGKNGSELYVNGEKLYEAPGLNVKALDTTGAGDAFSGAFLFQLLNRDEESLECFLRTEPETVLTLSNRLGAYQTLNYGAVENLPTYQNLLELDI